VNALPEVTAVVLHYGSAAATRRCLDSLAASEYPRLSVLIVNNSPAEPWRLARLPAPTVITPPTNTGYAGGNNLALRALRDAHRDGYALLLNNDAELAPAALPALVTCAETDPRIAFVGARGAAPDGAALDHGRVTFGPYLVGRPAPRAPAAVDAQWVSGCALLVRLAALPTIGLLDEEFFLYGEDVEWCLRARAAGYRVVHEPAAVVHHADGVSAATTTRRAYFLARNAILLSRRHGGALTQLRTIAACAALPAASLVRRLVQREPLVPAAWVWRGLLDGLRGRPPRLAALGLAPPPVRP
jgi:GT2 family glycosyltransferase